MGARIWLVRHAQGQHNATRNYNLLDPELTRRGEEQARAFYEETKELQGNNVVAILASPSWRCIQTAQLAFQGARQQGQQILLDPELQEAGLGLPENCNVPRALGNLVQLAGPAVDTRLLEGVDYRSREADSPFRTGAAANKERAVRARARLRALASEFGDDAIIAVVSHGSFCGWLVGGDDQSGLMRWENCQMRPYRFEADPFLPVFEDAPLVFSPHLRPGGREEEAREQARLMQPEASAPRQSNLRGILKRVRVDDDDDDDDDAASGSNGRRSAKKPQRKRRKTVTIDESQNLVQEFAAQAKLEYTVADMSPEFRYDVARLNPTTLMRARQVRRYCEIHAGRHGFADVLLEQAEVLQPEAWVVAAPDEPIWPEGWHPDAPRMDQYREAFVRGWRQVFNYGGAV